MGRAVGGRTLTSKILCTAEHSCQRAWNFSLRACMKAETQVQVGIPDPDTQERLTPSLCPRSFQPATSLPSSHHARSLGTDSPTHHRALCGNVFLQENSKDRQSQTLGHSTASPTCETSKHVTTNTSQATPARTSRKLQRDCLNAQREGKLGDSSAPHTGQHWFWVQVPAVNAQKPPIWPA